MTIRHFETFAGVGGFTLGIITGGWLFVKTIGTSETDKYASDVLRCVEPRDKNYGDITKIDWGRVPDFDLLSGGVPCQSWSVAGKRAGSALNR